MILLSLPPQGPVLDLHGGGNLVQNGTTISGIIHLDGSPCFDPAADDIIVTGSAVGSEKAFDGVITLKTAPVRGQTITITSGALPPPAPGVNSSFTGTFTLAGGTCAPQTSGTMTGSMVPSVSGPWKGNFSPALVGSAPIGVTANLSQTGPDAHGFFQITGNFSFSGSTCFSSGTVTSSSVLGATTSLTLTANDGSQLTFSPQLTSAATGPSLKVCMRSRLEHAASTAAKVC
ncbi:MAG TPA: hypothetical protein VE783_02860 [Candidatus Limnocylindrales bacterium]|nr:hypothetical protein [Candidatus Limnocylindrales bacterium]